MECISPITLKTGIHVPCGRCLNCLGNKRNDWTFRLYRELKTAQSAYFLTYTYNDESLIYGDSSPTVSKRELQLYIKRLRQEIKKYEVNHENKDECLKTAKNSLKFKYYAVGEYGTESERPHYHALFFNLPLGMPVHTTLAELWSEEGKSKGFIKVGTVTVRSISYVAGYLINPQTDEKGKEKQFSIMSTKPAIGAGYLETSGFFHKNNAKFTARMAGQSWRLPRYYKERIFSRKEIEQNTEKVREIIDNKINEEIFKYQEKGDSYFTNRMEEFNQRQIATKEKNKKLRKL